MSLGLDLSWYPFLFYGKKPVLINSLFCFRNYVGYSATITLSNCCQTKRYIFIIHVLQMGKLSSERNTVLLRVAELVKCWARIRTYVCLSSNPWFFILILCLWPVDLYILKLNPLNFASYLTSKWRKPPNSSLNGNKSPGPMKIILQEKELGAPFPLLSFHVDPLESEKDRTGICARTTGWITQPDAYHLVLCARHCAKGFSRTNSNPHNTTVRWLLSFSLYWNWENGGRER